jgi:hypothetical protein
VFYLAKKKELKRVKNKKYFNYKRRRGDRRDGWRVHSNDPVFYLIPHIMNTRLDSMVFFEERVDTEILDNFVRKLRRESEMKNLARLVVFMAVVVRAMSQYPKINRFVAGGKIYARNSISISLTVKKEMKLDSEESTITPSFSPDATLPEIWRIVQDELDKVKGANAEDNDTGAVVNLVSSLPQWLIKAVVNSFRRKDKKKGVPKFIHEASPFHASMFITDIGSVGIGSVYHHLYEFGTCSIFASMGRKEKVLALGENGEVKEKQTINFRFTVDERILDGYYYGKALRYMVHLMKHPELLMERPAEVKEDPLI